MGSKFKIKNDDDLCFARAVVVAIAKFGDRKKYDIIKHGEQGYKTSLQKREAQKLMTDAGLGDWTGPCAMDQFLQIQAVLEPEYQIKIFDKSVFNTLIYKGIFRIVILFKIIL